MLETHLAGIITEKRHNFDPSTSPAGVENLHFMLNREMRRAPRATSGWHAYGLGRCRPGELHGTVVPPQTSLGQSSIDNWTD
jgi:hypothetical protein